MDKTVKPTARQLRALNDAIDEAERNGRPYADFVGTGARADMIARMAEQGWAEGSGLLARVTDAGRHAAGRASTITIDVQPGDLVAWARCQGCAGRVVNPRNPAFTGQVLDIEVIQVCGSCARIDFRHVGTQVTALAYTLTRVDELPKVAPAPDFSTNVRDLTPAAPAAPAADAAPAYDVHAAERAAAAEGWLPSAPAQLGTCADCDEPATVPAQRPNGTPEGQRGAKCDRHAGPVRGLIGRPDIEVAALVDCLAEGNRVMYDGTNWTVVDELGTIAGNVDDDTVRAALAAGVVRQVDAPADEPDAMPYLVAATAVLHPPGTPEYAAYRAELRVELDKLAKGEPPYEYDRDGACELASADELRAEAAAAGALFEVQQQEAAAPAPAPRRPAKATLAQLPLLEAIAALGGIGVTHRAIVAEVDRQAGSVQREPGVGTWVALESKGFVTVDRGTPDNRGGNPRDYAYTMTPDGWAAAGFDEAATGTATDGRPWALARRGQVVTAAYGEVYAIGRCARDAEHSYAAAVALATKDHGAGTPFNLAWTVGIFADTYAANGR